MKITLCVLLFSLLAFSACQKSSNSTTPHITFIGLSPDSVQAGFSGDTAYLAFRIVDGDGDLGNQALSGDFDIWLKDSRNDSISGYYFPEIEPGIIDPREGVEGICVLSLNAAGLIPRQDSLHIKTGDTLRYEVYVKDQAGHESNRFTTNNLYIRP